MGREDEILSYAEEVQSRTAGDAPGGSAESSGKIMVLKGKERKSLQGKEIIFKNLIKKNKKPPWPEQPQMGGDG